MNHLAIVLALVGVLLDSWFTDSILPPETAREEMRRWVDAQFVI